MWLTLDHVILTVNTLLWQGTGNFIVPLSSSIMSGILKVMNNGFRQWISSLARRAIWAMVITKWSVLILFILVMFMILQWNGKLYGNFVWLQMVYQTQKRIWTSGTDLCLLNSVLRYLAMNCSICTQLWVEEIGNESFSLMLWFIIQGNRNGFDLELYEVFVAVWHGVCWLF